MNLAIRLIVSAYFFLGGLSHWLAHAFFVSIMPDYLPWHSALVFLSGVMELLGAVLLWIPRTRRLAGIGLMVLSVLVFPANVNMALNHSQFSTIPAWLLLVRLPMQGVILYLIYRAMQPCGTTVHRQ